MVRGQAIAVGSAVPGRWHANTRKPYAERCSWLVRSDIMACCTFLRPARTSSAVGSGDLLPREGCSASRSPTLLRVGVVASLRQQLCSDMIGYQPYS